MRTMYAEPMIADATATSPRAARLTTGALAIAMAVSGVAFLIGPPGVVDALHGLGYPPYFRLLLGPAKLLGAVALLASRRATLREWAYAGFTFTLLAAIGSHVVAGSVVDAVPAAVLLGLLAASYRLQRVAP